MKRAGLRGKNRQSKKSIKENNNDIQANRAKGELQKKQKDGGRAEENINNQEKYKSVIVGYKSKKLRISAT